MMLFQLFAAQNPAISEIAVLTEGTKISEGLPGFPPNRIPSLFGKYTTGEGFFISVWAVGEPLVFNPDVWISKKAGVHSVFSTITVDGTSLWVVQRVIAMREELKDFEKWSFILSFDEKMQENFCVSFLEIFLARTEFFFSSGRRLSDLSFPATLNVTGKK